MKMKKEKRKKKKKKSNLPFTKNLSNFDVVTLYQKCFVSAKK